MSGIQVNIVGLHCRAMSGCKSFFPPYEMFGTITLSPGAPLTAGAGRGLEPAIIKIFSPERR